MADKIIALRTNKAAKKIYPRGFVSIDDDSVLNGELGDSIFYGNWEKGCGFLGRWADWRLSSPDAARLDGGKHLDRPDGCRLSPFGAMERLLMFSLRHSAPSVEPQRNLYPWSAPIVL
jgi:hypothetical protein